MHYNKDVTLFLGSSMVEHPAVNRVVVGSSPTRGAIYWALSSAVEQGTHNPLAAGSNPAGPTKQNPRGAVGGIDRLGVDTLRRFSFPAL
jgi:hypothetical protein